MPEEKDSVEPPEACVLCDLPEGEEVCKVRCFVKGSCRDFFDELENCALRDCPRTEGEGSP